MPKESQPNTEVFPEPALRDTKARATVEVEGKRFETAAGIPDSSTDGTTTGAAAASRRQTDEHQSHIDEASEESFPASDPPGYNP